MPNACRLCVLSQSLLTLKTFWCNYEYNKHKKKLKTNFLSKLFGELVHFDET